MIANQSAGEAFALPVGLKLREQTFLDTSNGPQPTGSSCITVWRASLGRLDRAAGSFGDLLDRRHKPAVVVEIADDHRRGLLDGLAEV